MSLEQSLNENTAALKAMTELMAKLAAGQIALPVAPAGNDAPDAAKAKTTPAASTASSSKPAASADTGGGKTIADIETAMAEAKQLTVDLVNAKGAPAATAIIQSFGIKRTSECPPEKVIALRDALKAALAGETAESLT